MNSKEKLLENFKRILWLENQMKEAYSYYGSCLDDKGLLRSIKEIEDDEIRHINMAERIVSILQR